MNKNTLLFIASSLGLFLMINACNQSQPVQAKTYNKNIKTKNMNNDTLAEATFGAGCFWCVEAVFQQLKGVDTVISGYCGGEVENPTYKMICTGQTGHAEVCRIVFNPSVISFNQLLQAFFMSHDPTTLNRQGADVGTQYRSAIFYHDDQQKNEATQLINQLNSTQVFENKIVTTLEPLGKFYKAEDYHQNYFNLNGQESYCSFVIKPKLEKFRKVFPMELIKK